MQKMLYNTHIVKNIPESKLKIAREEAKLTQLEAAKKVNIHVNYYARIERGEAIPAGKVLKDLTKLFNLNATDILNF